MTNEACTMKRVIVVVVVIIVHEEINRADKTSSLVHSPLYRAFVESLSGTRTITAGLFLD
jgi:hypothetical protein